jgi:hypothetical protein
MIKRRKMRLHGEWQLDGRNQVYELTLHKFYLLFLALSLAKFSIYYVRNFTGGSRIIFLLSGAEGSSKAKAAFNPSQNS